MGRAGVVDASTVGEGDATVRIEADLVEDVQSGGLVLLKKVVAGSRDLAPDGNCAVCVAPVQSGRAKNEGIEVIGSAQRLGGRDSGKKSC